MNLHSAAWILVLVGGLNWLLVGLGGFIGGNWNVVNLILGSWPALESIVYILVGASAAYELSTHKNNCRKCAAGGSL
jgi:uncharacterized membrane protein YuzA (DUF378 family)